MPFYYKRLRNMPHRIKTNEAVGCEDAPPEGQAREERYSIILYQAGSSKQYARNTPGETTEELLKRKSACFGYLAIDLRMLMNSKIQKSTSFDRVSNRRLICTTRLGKKPEVVLPQALYLSKKEEHQFVGSPKPFRIPAAGDLCVLPADHPERQGVRL